MIKLHHKLTWSLNCSSDMPGQLLCEMTLFECLYILMRKTISDSLDNLNGQNVITWWCINGWYRLAYWNQNRAYVPGVHQLFCATCDADSNQSRLRKIGITRLYFGSVSCVPEAWICPFLFGFIQQFFFFFFLHFENEIDTGIIACDHSQTLR